MQRATQPHQNKDLDRRLANILSKKYAFQSRRSFMHRITVGTFGLLGVSLASKVPLFLVPEAKADFTHTGPAPWNWCGLDGNVCGAGGNCDGSLTTGVSGNSWIQCCQNTTADGCNLWHCCTYTDVCQTTPFTPDSGCQGQGTGGTTQWCSGGWDPPPPAQRYYFVCTKISCGSTGYADLSDCANDCHPHIDQTNGPFFCPGQNGGVGE